MSFCPTSTSLSRGLGGGRRAKAFPRPPAPRTTNHSKALQGLNSPEELGDSEPKDVTDDKAEGPQEEGGAEDLPDGPQQRAPHTPSWLQEGLGLCGLPTMAEAPFPLKHGCRSVP